MLNSEDDPVKDKLEEKVINTKKKKMGCCKCMFWTFSVLVGLIGCFFGGTYYLATRHMIPEQIANDLGHIGIQTFKAFDRNGDGYISIYEFVPLYHHLVNGGSGNPINITNEQEELYDQVITLVDEVVTVVPSFKPLIITSMMKDLDKHKRVGVMGWIEFAVRFALEKFEEGRRFLAGNPDPLYGLRSWQTANKKFLNFAVNHLHLFLPKDRFFDVGRVYHIIDDEQTLFQSIIADISSNRYFPPLVKEEHVTLHRLLTLFHPRPFIQSRFKPRGSVAMVRASNDKYFEIVFRVHAEFQLNQLPNYPFWFTPAQFTGKLIITHDLKHIEYFDMHVPNTKKLNVDMEWLEGGDNMVVDIGYLPEMSMKITAPSTPANSIVLEEKIPKRKFDVESMTWTMEIPVDEALRNLQIEMYPFQKVRYYNISESLEIAKKEDKLIHHILLWGALDDQSC